MHVNNEWPLKYSYKNTYKISTQRNKISVELENICHIIIPGKLDLIL